MALPLRQTPVVVDDDRLNVCTLGAFIANNAEGLDPAEISALESAISGGRVYAGGGGAAAAWTVQRLTLAGQRRRYMRDRAAGRCR